MQLSCYHQLCNKSLLVDVYLGDVDWISDKSCQFTSQGCELVLEFKRKIKARNNPEIPSQSFTFKLNKLTKMAKGEKILNLRFLNQSQKKIFKAEMKAYKDTNDPFLELIQEIQEIDQKEDPGCQKWYKKHQEANKVSSNHLI